MKRKITILLVFWLAFANNVLLASGDFMRSTGKIYVVVAVLAAIFVGVIIYLFSLDRKLTNLENQIKENGQDS